MGNKEKSTGGAAADRRTATTGIQHKGDQTTAFWREIQVVHKRSTHATGGPHSGGKEETGVDGRLPKWRNTNVPPGTRQGLRGVGSGRLCVGTRGKNMGTGSVYCGRRHTLHSGRLSETHGPTRPHKHQSCRTGVENIWTLTHATTVNATHHNTHTQGHGDVGEMREW